MTVFVNEEKEINSNLKKHILPIFYCLYYVLCLLVVFGSSSRRRGLGQNFLLVDLREFFSDLGLGGGRKK